MNKVEITDSTCEGIKLNAFYTIIHAIQCPIVIQGRGLLNEVLVKSKRE